MLPFAGSRPLGAEDAGRRPERRSRCPYPSGGVRRGSEGLLALLRPCLAGVPEGYGLGFEHAAPPFGAAVLLAGG